MPRTARPATQRLSPVILALVIAAAIGAALLVTGASGHGTLDQTLTGDPECNLSNFPATVSSTGELRQEFVPAQGQLLAVELCVEIGEGVHVDLNIRDGTANAAGAVLASASAVGQYTQSGNQFLHFDLAAPVATAAGRMLVIELPESPTFVWRGTCAEINVACTSIGPDLYPAGQANATQYRWVTDFGFRTYGNGEPAAPAKGDIDCDGSVTSVDALDVLRVVALLDVHLPAGCPAISIAGLALVRSDAVPQLTLARGDIDCEGTITAVDALMLLRYVAHLDVHLPDGCAPIGA